MCSYLLFLARLEYEQNRDMESRIKELEASISALKNDLEQVKDKEDRAKSSAEEVTGEVSQFKEEVQGTVLLPKLLMRSISLKLYSLSASENLLYDFYILALLWILDWIILDHTNQATLL